MNRDAIGSTQFRDRGRRHRLGLIRLPRLPQRGNVVDIDT
jgi:hypothetical protein